MNRPTRFLLGSSVLAGYILFVTTAVFAQAPYYYTLRPQGMGMRAAGLAEASSADATDVTGMFWNPGSVSFVRKPGMVFTHAIDTETHANTEQLASTVYRGAGVSLAVNGLYMHDGTLSPEGGPHVGIGMRGADVTASLLLLPTLSVGVMVGGREILLDTDRRTTGWGNVGLFYFPSPGISYGISYRILRGATYWFANAQSGVTWEPDPFQTIEMGATMSYPARSKSPFVMLSLSTEKVFPGVSLFSTKGGLEVLPIPMLALRVGFKVGSVERVARYGIGVNLYGVHIDAAYAPSRAENRFGGVSLMVDL
jgi:hypothetical protein